MSLNWLTFNLSHDLFLNALELQIAALIDDRKQSLTLK